MLVTLDFLCNAIERNQANENKQAQEKRRKNETNKNKYVQQFRTKAFQ